MRKHLLVVIGLMAGLCLLLAMGTATVSARTYTVNSSDDTDDGECNPTHCSLREAINSTNAHSGADTIAFNIPTSDPGYQVGVTGTWTISLTSALPYVSDDQTTIDGSTQTTYSSDANPDGPEIEITGAGLSSGSCLVVTSDENKIHGLVINRCPEHGIYIWPTKDDNTITGSYIGTDATGLLDLGNGLDGVHIEGGCEDNQVGGDKPDERNVLSGNDSDGVEISGSGAVSNTVSGNYIGTDRLGLGDVGNSVYGVNVSSGAQSNIIGGDSAQESNVISGNDSGGVSVYGSGTTGNTVSGNYVGTDAKGSGALGNGGFGAYVGAGAQSNVIGGDSAGERNVISGNDYQGVLISDSGTMSNTVSGNYIGTDASGSSGLGNGRSGVLVRSGAQSNVVGGNTSGERNTISGNGWEGVEIKDSGTMSNTVSGNYIGTDVAGSSDLGNSYDGVLIHSGAQHTIIGGDTYGERNIISGNDESGIWIEGSSTMSNTVSGNYIGTDESGSVDLGNTYHGVHVERGSHNTIGGETSAQRNVISGNDDDGVRVTHSDAMDNTIIGNYIGTDAAGSADLGNSDYGLTIQSGAHDNAVGGDTTGERNIISGNGGSGVHISMSGTTHNTVSGNYIGTDASGLVDVGNDGHGLQIYGGAQNNVIGGDTVGEGNVIAFNDLNGLWIYNPTTTGNTITENSIHSNNGLGIDLTTGGNTELAAPTIGMADCFSLYSGTAPSNATVEVFTGPDEEGKTYLTTVSADGGGNWTLVGSYTLDTYVTATATDAAGNTSEFSAAASAETCMQFFAPLAMKQY